MKTRARFNLPLIGLIALALGVLTACNQAPTATNNPTTNEPNPTNAAPNPTNSTETTGALSALPEDLRSEGTAWLGLDEPVTNTYRASGDPRLTGESTSTFTYKREGGELLVTFNRTGSLGIVLGNDTNAIENDGIFTTNMSVVTLNRPVLVMPADVKVGSTWKSEMETSNAAGAKATISQSTKAEAIEKVTIAGQTFDALRVVTTGTLTQDVNGAKSNGTIRSVTLYGRGVGILRSTQSVTIGSTKNEIKLELLSTKPGTDPGTGTKAETN